MADTISGLGGRDFMDGSGGDTVRVGDFSDRAFGEYGTDKLFGDAGNDLLSGGNAGDELTGGPGNDTVFADDGRLDSISCGPGAEDVAFVDQADIDAEGTNMQDFIRLTSCETIVEPVEEPPV